MAEATRAEQAAYNAALPELRSKQRVSVVLLMR